MGNHRAETEKTGPPPPTNPEVLQIGVHQDFLEDQNQEVGVEEAHRKEKRKRRRICKMKICFAVSFVIALAIGLSSALFRTPNIILFPLHASCNVTWTFSSSCQDVASSLLRQIEMWKTNATCGSGQKCLYALKSVEGNVIKATHTTPVRHFIDDLTYWFYPNSATSGCNVVGFSTSRIWYAILDAGTNYCNVHNLVEGAGLMSDSLYTELTNDSMCTQYTTANCEKY